jgi:NAD(P)-dependent dehydrogenase (short-subunit alcohol dehydrogenase family)
VGPTGTLVAMARQVDPELPGKASQRPGEDAQGALFDALGDYWCRGGTPDAIIAAGAVGPIRRDLTLPVYPFRHRRYWKSVGAGARAVGWHGVARLDMELLTARLRSPALREDLFETVFSRNRLPWLDDHRIFGAQVVSGASHLSLVLAALAQRAGVPGGSLRDVLFPAALVLPEDAERVTHLAIAPLSAPERDGAGDASETFRLVSLPDGDETKEPVLHCRGLIGLVPPSSAAIDVHAVWEAGGEPVEPEAVYALQQQRHIVLGPSYRWIDALRRAPGVALARLRAPAPVMPTLARHALHPGLIDACFGVLVTAGTSADSPDAGESFIPFAAQAVHWHRSVGEGALFAVARVRIQDAQRLVGDITLHDAQGESVAEFIGLEGRRAARHALLRDAEHAPLPACSVAWEPVDPVIRPPSGRWLVLADAQGVGDALVAALRDTGLDTFVAHADRGANALRRPSRDAFALAPASSAAFIELIAACGPLDHVVNLWALDGDPSEMTSLFGDLSAGVLHLSQALAGARPGPATRLWLATRGAQAVREGDRVPAPWQAIVWGMARAIGAEGAVPACACLDLDPDAPPGQAVPAMLRAACLPVAEDRIAWRGGRLQVARLVQTSATPSAEPEWPQDRSQVITGAGGALGRALAQWLAARGVRHLALLSRTPPDAAFLDTLRASGAQPRAWAVDVADAAALARVLASVAAEQAPVGRIFHLAGLLDDRSVASQTAERCAAVLAPKALGAWHLHLHAVSEPDASPDWVVFSSVAGWLDAPGQLAYAAANAFLDALAAHRRAAGLPALSLAWGPWAEIGMAARMSPAAQAGLAARGFAPIDPERGWRTLGALLTAPRDAASVALVDADWLRHAGARPSAFLLRVAQADAPAIAAQGRGALRERLTAMTALERGALIRAELIGLVAAVLRLPRSEVGPRVRLFDLGVDSLTALELKRHLEGLLGLTLSSTLLFDFPSIDALTRHLLDEALPASGFAAGATTDPRPDAPAATDVVAGAQDAVAALTEDEAEAELLARLSAFETPGDRQA